jgi:hypothetical protein
MSSPDMGGDDLLWRQAAALTLAANARAENEGGLPRHDWRHQIGNKFYRIASIAIDKKQNFRILAHRSDTSLDGTPVAAGTVIKPLSEFNGFCVAP